MTNLTRCTCKSRIHTAVLDHTSTDARTHEDTNKDFEALSRIINEFSQCSYFYIIAHSNGFAKLSTENINQMHIFDTQIGRINDDARFTINLTRSPHTNSHDR